MDILLCTQLVIGNQPVQKLLTLVGGDSFQWHISKVRQHVVLVVAHSHAERSFAYLAFVELLQEVVCKLVEGGGDGALLVFITLFCIA